MNFSLVFLSCLILSVGNGIALAVFALLVEATGASGLLVGLNAALPPLGGVIGALLVPVFQIRIGIHIQRIVIAFTLFGTASLFIPIVHEGFWALSGSRFILGATIGVFLRSAEYIIVASTQQSNRGRYVGLMGMCIMLGVILGSVTAPSMLASISVAATVSAGFMALAVFIFDFFRVGDLQVVQKRIAMKDLKLFRFAPFAFVGVTAYALFEPVPAYFMQIYALRSGFDEATATYTLAAAALGNFVFLLPLMLLSDRVGRLPVLVGCTVVAGIAPLGILSANGNATILLTYIALMGASAGAVFGLVFAILGDRFAGNALVLGTALFGVLYAAGSIVGPLIHGGMIEMFGNDGLMYSVSAVFIALLLAMAVIWKISGRRSGNLPDSL